jgi:hypothetical protein
MLKKIKKGKTLHVHKYIVAVETTNGSVVTVSYKYCLNLDEVNNVKKNFEGAKKLRKILVYKATHKFVQGFAKAI